MSRRLRDTDRVTDFSDDMPRPPFRMRHARERRADILADPRFQFDPDAWAALLEEQRLIIAGAAGVDPSKVRIHVGH